MSINQPVMQQQPKHSRKYASGAEMDYISGKEGMKGLIKNQNSDATQQNSSIDATEEEQMQMCLQNN